MAYIDYRHVLLLDGRMDQAHFGTKRSVSGTKNKQQTTFSNFDHCCKKLNNRNTKSYFPRKRRKKSQNLSSAATVISALRAKVMEYALKIIL